MRGTSQKDKHIRFTQTPVWKEARDTGGMFPVDLLVYQYPDPGELPPFLAVVTEWGGGYSARRATKEAAIAHTYVLLAKYYGVEA